MAQPWSDQDWAERSLPVAVVGETFFNVQSGKTKKVKVYENSKLASLYDPGNPDENVPYYQDKLLALIEKFREFLPKDEAEAPQAPLKAKKARRRSED